MPSANLFRIPQFISAPTKERLARLLLKNNLKHGIEFDYRILKDGNDWVAWFYLELDRKKLFADSKNVKELEVKKGVDDAVTKDD